MTAVHSMAGTLDAAGGLIRRPPFEDPHHTSTVVSLVGGGSGLPHPGAASRAHRGVLFLDEAAEFEPRVLEALRQPLEHGELVIHRSHGVGAVSRAVPARPRVQSRAPAAWPVVAASNASARRRCAAGTSCACPALCSTGWTSRWRSWRSREPRWRTARSRRTARSSPSAWPRRARCNAERLVGTPWTCNGEVSGRWLRTERKLPLSATREADLAVDRNQLSVRGYDRVLRLAWTLSDLAGRVSPGEAEINTAMQLRQRGSVPV